MKKTVTLFVFLCVCLAAFAFEALPSEFQTAEGVFKAEDYVGWHVEDKGRPSVALVLSGGGAKGLAHIAFLEALETYGIPIDKIYGTSMGALIGGMYAAGYTPKELKELVLNNNLMKLFTSLMSSGYNEVLEAFDFNSNNVFSIPLDHGIGAVSGLLDDYQILNFFNYCVGNVPDGIDFNRDLSVPFTCNAINMIDGSEYVFEGGSLIEAMRASMSLPLIFEPVLMEDGSVLMDGGLVSNRTVHLAIKEGYDIILCVSVSVSDGDDMKADDYRSISGVLFNTLNIVMKNVSRGEEELADYSFYPDVNEEFNTLSFNKAREIIEKGYEEIDNRHEYFEELAALFTEEQKEYKDPDRMGDYFIKYSELERTEYLSSKQTQHEDVFAKTRVSIGIFGEGGFGFDFTGKERVKTRLFPAVSIRGFLKDIKGTRLSLDLRFKLTVGRTADISAFVLHRLTPDHGERLFGFGGATVQAGSLSAITDRANNYFSFNVLETAVTGKLGLKLTDERTHSINLSAEAANLWIEVTETATGRNYLFMPELKLDGVIYPGYTNGIINDSGARIDFIISGGWVINTESIKYGGDKGSWFYRLKFAAERNFDLGNGNSIWLDVSASSQRAPMILRSSFDEYGGWDGMPGYVSGTRYADFICGGIGYQREVSTGFLDGYVIVQIRGGVRSEEAFNLWSFISTHESMVPFYECFNNFKWDLGIDVGYGINSPFGDLIVGAGFNKDLQFALYLEMR